MKNKKQVFFLLPTVALVWGLIIYKVINGASSDHTAYKPVNKVAASTHPVVSTDEPYTLVLDYDDPFGKVSKPRAKKSVQPKAKPVKKKVVKAETPEIDLSKFIYQGMVQNASSKQKIALVLVNDQMKMVKKGDLIDEECKVVEIRKDAIQIKLNKDTFTIKSL